MRSTFCLEPRKENVNVYSLLWSDDPSWGPWPVLIVASKITACIKMFLLHFYPCFPVPLFSFLSFLSFSLSSSKHGFRSLIGPSSNPNTTFTSSRNSIHLQDLRHSVACIRKCSLSYLAHVWHSIDSKPERTKYKWYFFKSTGEDAKQRIKWVGKKASEGDVAS